MKLFKLLVYTFFISSMIYAQSPVVTSAEKFNKRGFYKNDDARMVGNEIISDYDGNLMLQYNTKLNLPGSFESDFSLSYNTNVAHIANLCSYNQNNGNLIVEMGYPINNPEWILGFRGFALQTMNFEQDFYMQHQNGGAVYRDSLRGEEAPLLIPGYHFSNLLRLDDQFTQDVIKILMADGSVKQLINSSSGNEREGLYFEQGSCDSRGIAYVKKRTDTLTNLSYGPREIYYKPGDGYTYLFQEQIIHFKNRDSSTLSGCYGSDISCYGYPKAIYLKAVFSAATGTTDTLLVFNYSPAKSSNNWGRDLFRGIKSLRKKSLPASDELTMSYLFTDTANFVTIANLANGDNFSLKLSRADSLLNPQYCFANSSRILRVISIKDQCGRIDSFYYYPYKSDANQPINFSLRRDYTSNSLFRIHTEPALCKTIKYSSGKTTELTYWGRTYNNPDFPYYLNLSSGLPRIGMMDNLEQAYRDCYTNYMLKSRTVSNMVNNTSAKVDSEYYYYWTKPNPSVSDDIINDSLFTTIVTKNLTSGDTLFKSSPSDTVIKNYSKYLTFYHGAFWNDYSSTIRLISETKTDGSLKLTDEYEYDTGNQVWDIGSYYDGRFSTLKHKTKRQISGGTAITTEERYSYLFDTLVVNSSYRGSKYFAKKTWEKGILNDSTFRQNKNFIPGTLQNPGKYLITAQSIPDKNTFAHSYLYKTGLPEIEKVYSGSLVKKHVRQTYYENNNYGCIGMVDSTINNPDTRPVIAKNVYYSCLNDLYYAGNLSKVISNSGLETDFYYPPLQSGTIHDTISGYCELKTGSRIKSLFHHSGLQNQPFRTEVILSNTDTLKYYSSYNSLGKLEFEVDYNGNYSEYAYDHIGRLTRASLPGSFASGSTSFTADNILNGDSISTGSVFYNYNDASNIVTEQRVVDGSNDTVYATSVQYSDALGNVIKTSAVNDGDTLECKYEKNYNFRNLPYYERNGVGNILYNKYDLMQRKIATIYNSTTGLAASSTYTLLNNDSLMVEKKSDIDEENRGVKDSYFDRAGNLRKEMVGTTVLAEYEYDNIYRLTKVKSGSGKETTYQYNDLGNISQVINPDEGTTRYLYDKYGNLRFSNNSAAPASNSTGIVTHKYDALKRLVLTANLMLGSNSNNFLLMDPDHDYATSDYVATHFEDMNSDTAKHVCVNMYDKYQKFGIFTQMVDPYNGFDTVISKYGNIKGRLVATAFRDKRGGRWSYKIYLYDSHGRDTSMWVKFQTTIWRNVSTKYDNLGNVITSTAKELSSTSRYYSHYTYDKQGRLDSVYTGTSPLRSSCTAEADYTYDAADKVTNLYLPNGQSGMSYSYNDRGWLSKIISGNGYYEKLSYKNNGLISKQIIENSYKTSLGWCPQVNLYYYNSKNMLDSMLCRNLPQYSERYRYDLDGNITSKNRADKEVTLNYAGTNRVSSTVINDSLRIFSYDWRGNVTNDGTNQITDYDYRNLPLSITNNGVTTNYYYDDQGNRISKVNTSGLADLYLRDPNGRELAVINLNSGATKQMNIFGIDQIGSADITWNGSTNVFSRQYYIKDHLGSIRFTTGGGGTIAAARNYYPYGDLQQEYVNSSYNTKYKFTGKERDTESGLDYFGARYYNSELGRWYSVDPAYAKYPGWSPYNYCASNPISYIDANGDTIWIHYIDNDIRGSKVYYSDGQLFNANGSLYTGHNSYALSVLRDLNKLSAGEVGLDLVNYFSGANNVDIVYGNSNRAGMQENGNAYIHYNPSIATGGFDINGSEARPGFVSLAHELGHARNHLDGSFDSGIWYWAEKDIPILRDEIRACFLENLIRLEHNIPERQYYTTIQEPSGLRRPDPRSKVFTLRQFMHTIIGSK